MDTFIEKIVARKKNTKDYLAMLWIVLITIVVVYAIMLIPIATVRNVIPFLITGAIYAAYYFITSRNIEYEYALTNGSIDIDKIISKRKRVRLLSADCKSFDFIAGCKSGKFQEVESIKKRIEAVSSMDSPYIFCAVLNQNGEKKALFFEPDTRMRDSFKTYIPHKVFE